VSLLAGMYTCPLKPKRLSPLNSRFEVWGKKGRGTNILEIGIIKKGET
jgi:hypothetical protein